MVDTQYVERFLKAQPFFSGLPDEYVRRFILSATVKSYDKHQLIITHGETASGLFFVMEGWVKLYRSLQNGGEAVLSVCAVGDVFGEASVMTEGSYTFSAQAAEKAVLVEIPAHIMRTAAAENPEIMKRIIGMISRELDHAQSDKEHLSLMSAAQRVGCLLLQISAGMIGKGGTFVFPYDKSLAAARLGMKPETFSRALAQLKSVDVDVIGAEIRISSFEGLIKYCCQQCSSGMSDCRGCKKAGI